MKTLPPTTLAEAISADREKFKKSQDDIAKFVGVTQQAVSDWENGRIPRGPRWAKLAAFFGATSETAKLAHQRGFLSSYTSDDVLKRYKLRPAPGLDLSDHQPLHTSGEHIRRPKGAKSMGDMSSDPGDKTPPMSADEPHPRAPESQATYGIRSFEAPQDNLNADEMHDALTRAASGVQLARQVLDDASNQIARALSHLQKA